MTSSIADDLPAGMMMDDEKKCRLCLAKSTSKCSNCKQVYYCTVAHQKSDWKQHKLQCHPFSISTNEQFGRHLIASRDIRAGEVVLRESPLVRGPSQITPPVCVGCLQGLPEELQIECERCGWPVCTQSCQNTPAHQLECQLTVARGSKVSMQHYFSPHPTYQCMTTLRCLLLKEHDPSKWQQLIQLESHCEERRGSIQWRNDREGVAKFIPRFFKCDRWTEEEILKVAGIVQINGHEVPLTDPSYVAIYYMASLIEHSCMPNLTKSFTSKGEVVFWAPEAIESGEHLSICYSDVLWGTANRQHHLMQTKMFQCACCRCLDVTEFGTFFSGIKCKDSSTCDGIMLPIDVKDGWDNDWRCTKCSLVVQFAYINNILDRAGKDAEAMEKGSEQNCIKYLEHYGKWLSANHYNMVDIKIALVQIIGSGGPQVIQGISDEELQLKIRYAKELISLFKKIAPAEARILGAISFELHAGLAELGRRGAQQLNANFRGTLEESLSSAVDVIRYLQHEPIELSEGQMCAQARLNADSLRVML